jgi:hypothetical protein
MNRSLTTPKEYLDNLEWNEIRLGYAKLLLGEFMNDKNFCNSTNEEKAAILGNAVKQKMEAQMIKNETGTV